MQTSISATGQPRGFAGQVLELLMSASAHNEEASAEMEFGSGVRFGTADRGCLKPSAAAQKVKGVVMHSHNHQPGTDGDLGTTGLKPDAQFSVLRKGAIALKLDAGVTSVAPGDRGHLRHTSDGGSNTVTGRWSNAADSGGGGRTLDCTKQVVFTSSIWTAADGTKCADAEVDFTNEPD